MVSQPYLFLQFVTSSRVTKSHFKVTGLLHLQRIVIGAMQCIPIVTAVVFALVGTLVFASVAPYLSEADGTRLIKICPGPKGDQNTDRPGCGKSSSPPKKNRIINSLTFLD
jgi:hypothetical protein